MIQNRIRLGFLEALAFDRRRVQKLRPRKIDQRLQNSDQPLDIVAVDRPDIVESQLLEQSPGQRHSFEMLVRAAREVARDRHPRQRALAAFAHAVVKAARQDAHKRVFERAHRRRDRHFVVVQHHQQVDLRRRPGVIERLESHPARQRAVADDRDRAPLFAAPLGRDGHAQRGGNRSARVRGAEAIVRAFGAARKARNPALFAHPRERLAASGQRLVGVTLMPDIPDQKIARRVENIMQRDGELDRSQIRGQMPSGAAHGFEDESAQLRRHGGQIVARQFAQIGRVVDRF